MKIIISIIFTFLLTNNSFSSENVLNQASLYTVKIRTSIDRPFHEDDKAGLIRGSGFLIDKENGLIITNAHITGRSKSKIKVAFKDYGFETAKQVYIDPHIDIAIIKINPKLIPHVTIEAKLKCEGKVKNGALVAAFGHPKGLSFSSSRGIVSKYRFWNGKDVIQTDAAINKGNSGGPLIDISTGLIIGINKSSYKKSSGLSFAVPANKVCLILNLIKNSKDPSPVILPIRFAEDRESENYMMVASFYHEGKNKEIGSSLLAINNQEIHTPSELDMFLRGKSGNVKLTFRKKETISHYNIPIIRKNKLLDRKYIYLAGAVISNDPRVRFEDTRKKFLIHSVIDGTEAELAGLWQHCWIKSLDGIEPQSLSELFNLSIGKNDIGIITRCYSYRDDIISDDYFVKLNTKDQKITIH